MQFIFLLLSLFAIGCVLYGISAGVQTITRGATRLAGGHCAKAETPRAAPSSAQSCLHELQELHRLYQGGALSREEFDQFKQYILSTIAPKESEPGRGQRDTQE